MNSIFDYERSDVIAAMNRTARIHNAIRIVALGALAGLLAALAYRTLMPLISAAPAPEKPIVMVNGEEGDLTTLCARYRSDHLMTGEGMERETADLCGF